MAGPAGRSGGKRRRRRHRPGGNWRRRQHRPGGNGPFFTRLSGGKGWADIVSTATGALPLLRPDRFSVRPLFRSIVPMPDRPFLRSAVYVKNKRKNVAIGEWPGNWPGLSEPWPEALSSGSVSMESSFALLMLPCVRGPGAIRMIWERQELQCASNVGLDQKRSSQQRQKCHYLFVFMVSCTK